MSNIPSELKYTSTHEWVRLEEDGTATIGITDHAQELLGDLVFVELPEVATNVKEGDEVGVVESVKAASDMYSPLSGEIIAINETLREKPDLINVDPYGEGWILVIKPLDTEAVRGLMLADEYQDQIEAEE